VVYDYKRRCILAIQGRKKFGNFLKIRKNMK